MHMQVVDRIPWGHVEAERCISGFCITERLLANRQHLSNYFGIVLALQRATVADMLLRYHQQVTVGGWLDCMEHDKIRVLIFDVGRPLSLDYAAEHARHDLLRSIIDHTFVQFRHVAAARHPNT